MDAPIVTGKLLGHETYPMAEIIEACVTPLTDDITGKIQGGYICFRALLYPIKIEKCTKRKGQLTLRWYWGRSEVWQTIPDVWPQSAVEVLQFVPLVIVVTDENGPDGRPDIHGLALQAVEGKEEVYQRWGHVVFLGQTEREILYSNFGVQRINAEWTYNPPEK